MQVVLSIQAGKILPSTLLRKFGSHSRQNKLNRAFGDLGRIERPLFLLHYVSEADFRPIIRADTTTGGVFHVRSHYAHNSIRCWRNPGARVSNSGDLASIRASSRAAATR